jgi:hypothetical protein
MMLTVVQTLFYIDAVKHDISFAVDAALFDDLRETNCGAVL